MFDLAAGATDRPFRDRRIVPTIVSVVAHVALIGAVVSATWYVVTEGLPEVPTMMAFVAEAPPPPPPPPPPAPPAARREPAEAPKPVSSPSPVPVSERAPVAPTVAPTAIGPESGLGFEAFEGVTGGVEGGIPGGVPGGVVGGLVTEVQPPPPPPAVEEAPVRVGGAVEVPALIRRVEPIYPKPAVAARITGLVILEAKVNEHGEVTDIKVLRSHKLLDRAAIDAVRQWRYEPLLLNGTPRAFVLTVSLSFSLE